MSKNALTLSSGSLDQVNTRELVERITEAAKRARLDIIISCEHLRDATPEALRALVDSQLWQAAVPYAKIHYRKFKAAFEASLEGLSTNSLYEDDPNLEAKSMWLIERSQRCRYREAASAIYRQTQLTHSA